MLRKEFKQEIIDYYKSIDCKYIVLKIEDLVNTFTDYEECEVFMDLIERYNVYRKMAGKKVNKYFVINRDNAPTFETAQEFFDYLKSDGLLYEDRMDTKSKLENS